MQYFLDFYNGRKGIFLTFIWSLLILITLLLLCALIFIASQVIGALFLAAIILLWPFFSAVAHINASTYKR